MYSGNQVIYLYYLTRKLAKLGHEVSRHNEHVLCKYYLQVKEEIDNGQ